MHKAWMSACLCLCCVGLLPAEKLDFEAFVRETQEARFVDRGFKLVWWLPVEFFDYVLGGNPALTEEARTQIKDTLAQHEVVAVVDGRIGMLGGLITRSRPLILTNLSLTTPAGTTLRPMNEADLEAEVKNFLDLIRQTIANATGEFGRGLHFFVFAPEDKALPEGERLVDPRGSGTLTVAYADTDYTWTLPLKSLVEPKAPGSEFPENFRFNPFTGEPLGQDADTAVADVETAPAPAQAAPAVAQPQPAAEQEPAQQVSAQTAAKTSSQLRKAFAARQAKEQGQPAFTRSEASGTVATGSESTDGETSVDAER